jgi:hypothetical protein
MMAAALIYTVVAWFLSLKEPNKAVGEGCVTLGSVICIGCSLANLVYQTCKLYPVDCVWIKANFGAVGLFMGIMVECSGICSPGQYLMRKVFFLHGSMLTSRLMFDLGQVAGMDLH